MQSLIVRRGFTKRAAEEDGPSFEQQFGILTNAVIADKFPQLDAMKLAFQLIEKEEDNSKACGAAVYMVGNSIVFVPSFFRNNKLQTGDIMLVAQTQQFLPLSDAWLAWLKTKDLNDAGEQVPPMAVEQNTGAKGVTIRDMSDPILKTASVYLRGLLHTDPDLSITRQQTSILDTALHMGKQASETLLDNLIKNNNFLNAALTFYSGDELDIFAKKAYAMAEPEQMVELIMPLDKEAKTLNEKELKALYKDGFFIRKTAADTRATPYVIRSKQISGMFSAIRDAGTYKLLKQNGDVDEAVVVRRVEGKDCCGDVCCCDSGKPADPGMSAASYMEAKAHLFTVDEDGMHPLPADAMAMTDSREKFTEDTLKGIGKKLEGSNIKRIPYGAYLIYADGTCCAIHDTLNRSSDGDAWTGFGINESDRVASVEVSADKAGKLLHPIKSGNTLIVPKDTHIVLPPDAKADGMPMDRDYTPPRESGPACVTMATLDAFVTAYCQKRYHKTSIWHDGSEYTISGDKSERSDPKSVKEAALQLVTEYAIDPAVAKVMLKEAANGATYDNPKKTSFFITKTAEEAAEWQDANIPMSETRNIPPKIEQEAMPTVLEDPEKLQQAVISAAQNGIKEVFDLTALKLMIRQNRFFDEIHDDIPLFMQALDSLCRKLFQFYWHTDKMEEKYGMVKMKALEESLKCTLESLSDLTIFFKTRTVDGSGSTGDVTSDLMAGRLF